MEIRARRKTGPAKISTEISGPEEIREEKDKKPVLEKILDGIFSFSLFMNFLGLPLFFTSLTFQGIVFEKEIYFYFWTAVALVAFISKSVRAGELKIKRTFLYVPIILFWLFYLVASIFSIDKWHSFIGSFGDPSRGFLNITALVIVYYLLVSSFTPRLFRWLLGAFLASGSLVVLRALAGLFSLKILPAKILAQLPLNFFGSMESLVVLASLMLPILAALVLKLQAEDKMKKASRNFLSALFMILIAANLFLIFNLYSYAVWPALLIGMGVFLIYILARIVNPKESWSWLPMLIFVAVVVFLMVGSVKLSKANLPLSANIPFKSSMEIAKQSIKDNMFVGYGPGNFGYAFSKDVPAGFDAKGLRLFQGQGLLFESISTIGILGTILLLVMLFTFLGASFFLLSKEKEKNKLYSLGMFAASLIFLLNALFLKIEGPVLILGVFIVALTVATLLKESAAEESYASVSLKASPKYAMTLAFIFLLILVGAAYMFIFIGKLYAADLYMGSAVRQEKKEISEQGSIAQIAKAINLNKKEGIYYSRLGQEYAVLANNEALKSSDSRDTTKIQTYLNSAIQYGKTGENMMSKDVTVTESLAQIYDNAGSYIPDALSLAGEEYNKALQLEPQNPDFYVKLGQLKIKELSPKSDDNARKDLLGQAADLFNQALKLRDNYAPAYYNLALTEEALGQLDDAIYNMGKAATIQKNSVDYVFNLARLYQKRGTDSDLKMSETLYNKILSADANNINTHFNLGLLYEKTGRKSAAEAEYKKVLDLLPAGSDQVKSQIEKMIENIQNGIENNAGNLQANQQNNL